MKRLGFALTLVGLCAVLGACDGSRGLTEPAGRLQNIGTIGSGHRDSTAGDATTQENGGTIGSGHREGVDGVGAGGVTTQNIGTSGSGLKEEGSVPPAV
jgi:hypothetical protein